eukprot:4200634-Pyramimonas_sp.AAC.1
MAHWKKPDEGKELKPGSPGKQLFQIIVGSAAAADFEEKKNTAVQSTKDLLQTFMDGKIKISDLKPAARKIKESLDSGSEAEATGAEASADLGEIECEGDEEEYEDEFDENSESGDDEDGEE